MQKFRFLKIFDTVMEKKLNKDIESPSTTKENPETKEKLENGKAEERVFKKRKVEERILKKQGFTLGREIGCGTFAKVKLADWSHEGKNERLAVKIINRLKASKEFVEKFMPRELDIWPTLEHSNIIKVHSILTIKEKSFIFMELAENGDMIEYLHKNGAVPEAQAQKWFSQLVKALKYCQRKGIAHRDVKCENLLLDKDNNIKLADFGFSRFCVDNATHQRLLSSTYCGSAAYAAPEILRGKPYNPLMADVWSAGICLFVMLNNSMPFDDGNVNKLYKDQVNKNWHYRSKIEPKLSSEVKYLIHKMLEPDIFHRVNLEQVSRNNWVANVRH